MTLVLNWRGAAWLFACILAVMMAATMLSTQRAEADTIHDVVSQTWPAPLVPTAEQIAYHEDPYYCSAKAYELYRMYGWAPWTTYGWYTPGAGQTSITYY
jgi:hypothetical protein